MPANYRAKPDTPEEKQQSVFGYRVAESEIAAAEPCFAHPESASFVFSKTKAANESIGFVGITEMFFVSDFTARD